MKHMLNKKNLLPIMPSVSVKQVHDLQLLSEAVIWIKDACESLIFI